MDTLKKIFPFAWKWGKDEFVKGVVLHALVILFGGVVFNIVAAIVSFIPVLPWLVSVVGFVVGLYALVSLILQILIKVDVIKD